MLTIYPKEFYLFVILQELSNNERLNLALSWFTISCIPSFSYFRKFTILFLPIFLFNISYIKNEQGIALESNMNFIS